MPDKPEKTQRIYRSKRSAKWTEDVNGILTGSCYKICRHSLEILTFDRSGSLLKRNLKRIFEDHSSQSVVVLSFEDCSYLLFYKDPFQRRFGELLIYFSFELYLIFISLVNDIKKLKLHNECTCLALYVYSLLFSFIYFLGFTNYVVTFRHEIRNTRKL